MAIHPDGEKRREFEVHISEVQEIYAQKRILEKNLEKKENQLATINQLTTALLSTMELEQLLRRILVGVTANEGLGFNRAFLLLVNRNRNQLEGRMAVGPANLEEALRIWGEMSHRKLTFSDLIASLEENPGERDLHVNRMVRQIAIPLEDRSHVLIQLLNQTHSEVLELGSSSMASAQALFEGFAVACLAIVPLTFRNHALGLLLADNAITQKPITSELLRMLEIFSHYAAAALEHSRLFEEVRLRVRQNERHIHELEMMQDRLLRSKRLSELGELASKMAHEIRTPLASIGGFAHSMLKDKASDAPEREYLEIIVEEVRRLEGILTNVLTFVSPGVPRTRPCDVEDLMRQALFLLRSSLEEAKIRLECDLTEAAPPLMLDPDQIKQVLLAVLHNALDSMPKGGVLRVATTINDDFLQIKINDTGVGIEKEQLGKVFDAFFTTKSKGSGLGLNIASQIIANHKGSIYVESEVGLGSTFFINLPLGHRVATMPPTIAAR
jgi:signal transduction histidine kinase